MTTSCSYFTEKRFTYDINDYSYQKNDSLYIQLQKKSEDKFNRLKVVKDTIEYLERIINADILTLDSLNANLGFFQKDEAAQVADHYSKSDFPKRSGKCLMIIDREFSDLDSTYNHKIYSAKLNKDSASSKDWEIMFLGTPINFQKGFLSTTIQEVREAEREVLIHLLNDKR